MTIISEEDLLKNIRDLNVNVAHDALKTFYKENWISARNFIKQFGLQPMDIEEVYQDAVTIFYEKLRRSEFEFSSSPKTFLFGVIKNLVRSKIKKNQKHNFLELENVQQSSEDVEEHYMRSEKNEILLKKVKMLGLKCQEVLTLFYFERLSMLKIAEHLGYANAQVAKNKKAGCLNQLRELYHIKN